MNRSHTPIIKRHVNMDFSPASTLAWMQDKCDYKASLNAMSFSFPIGENYFIKSVKFYQDKIRDQELKARTRGFIYQEAMHNKEHARANKLLLDVYPDGKLMEGITKVLLDISRRYTPHSTQLATTCALEHFTAIFAHALLSRQEEFLAESDGVYANFWLWHAVEESEHKSVCFDVYEHIFGKGLLSYLHRVAIMLLVSIFFTLSVGIGFAVIRFKQRLSQLRLKVKDSNSTKGKSSRVRGAAKLSALFKGVAPSNYFDYYRRTFHPDDTDSSKLINKWKVKYAELGPAIGIGYPTDVTLPSDFNAQAYLQLNPDVASARVDPAEHYLRHGYKEGRAYRHDLS
jgi:predicted metal-dependent hydrolase